MDVSLYVLVRSLPDGRFRAVSIDVPRIRVFGAARDAAVAEVTSLLRAHVPRLGSDAREALGKLIEPRFLLVPVEARLRKQESLTLTVALVVAKRPSSGGMVFRVRAQEFGGFDLVTQNEAEIAETAARDLAKRFRDWNFDDVMSMDDAGGEAEFVEVRMTLPRRREHFDDDDDSSDVLHGFGDELTALAREGKLSSLDVRDELVDRVLGLLGSAGRSSVMLVGPVDVGKTTLVHELAHRLVRGDVPPPLQGRELWRIPANELIAGSRYTGTWQDRARKLVGSARDNGPIIAMGDPAAIVDAGKWSGSDNNLARFLRTYVEAGDISVVCETTEDALAAVSDKEPSFANAFHRVDVAEPSLEQTTEILRAAARRLGDRLAVTVDESAISASIELTRRFEPYRGLPGKAVNLLDEAARDVGEGRSVSREEVVSAFTTRSGLPRAILSDETPLDLDAARAFFEERVLGQQDAVAAVVELLSVVKAGLNDPAKPLGTFFFVGPTGVGKTELAKALAEFLFGSRERLIRLDMGEFGSGDAPARLVGTAWDRDSDGKLTASVRGQPFSVVLLDEIEKAHAGVFDVLLSVLGEARVSDARGRTADFRNAIVIMTSNLGADRSESHGIGFTSGGDEAERRRAHFLEQAEKFFRPEFVNRIDRIVVFDALPRDVVRRIARREVGRLMLREGLVRRRLLVEVDEAAIDALAAKGFDPKYGARPLQREIERAVSQPLARLIVTKRPEPGDVVRVHLEDGRLAVDVAPPPRTPEERRESRRERRVAPVQASTARLARAAESLFEEIDAEATGPVATALRQTVGVLVDRTRAPTFWDDPEQAREGVARVYGIERVLERIDGLRDRARGLIELARHAHRTNDRSRIAELRAAIGEIGDAFDLVRLELLGAAEQDGRDATAVVRVNPMGEKSPAWAEELLSMYRGWAERTGREARTESNGQHAIVIEGPSSLQLLACECGVHRRRLPDRTERLARVLVTDRDGALPEDAEPEAVVRVYEEGRRTGVRDPRSGVRSGTLAEVLAGRIEPFLIGSLRDRRDRA